MTLSGRQFYGLVGLDLNGSNLEATSGATLPFANTLFATCGAVLAWTLGESFVKAANAGCSIRYDCRTSSNNPSMWFSWNYGRYHNWGNRWFVVCGRVPG